MYASRVELVGTEKGLGVNLRGTVSATRAVSLDVNGNLRTSGSLYSDGTASVRAEDIENHGLIYGGKDTSVTAAALTNSADGRIYGDTIRIQAKTITNETDAALEERLAKEMKVLKEREAAVEEAHQSILTDESARRKFGGRNLHSIVDRYNEEIGAAQGAYDAQQAIVEKTKTALAENPRRHCRTKRTHAQCREHQEQRQCPPLLRRRSLSYGKRRTKEPRCAHRSTGKYAHHRARREERERRLCGKARRHREATYKPHQESLSMSRDTKKRERYFPQANSESLIMATVRITAKWP